MISSAGFDKRLRGEAMASKQAKIIERVIIRSAEFEERLQNLEENVGTMWHLRIAIFVSNVAGFLVLIAVWLAIT